MQRRLIASVLAALSFVQNSAYADLSDLPNPADFDDEPTVQSPVVEQKPEIQQTQYAGSLNISEMSRKSGGTLYKVELKQAISLARLDVRVTKSQLKILQTTLTTDSGQKIDVRALKNTAVLGTGSVASSESLNQSDRISSIEILAEAFGGEADVMLTALGAREIPKLALKVQQQEVPQTPPAPPAPPVVDSGRPGRYEPPVSRRAANNTRPLREGEQVVVMERDYARAVVLGFDNRGNHIIRFLTGNLAGRMGDNWGREALSPMTGCTEDYCVGDVVYNKDKGEAQVRVVAVQYNGAVIIEFLDGALAGRLGGQWTSNDLTSTERCGKNFCVGQRAYLYDDGRDPALVEVIAVDKAGRYTVYFHEGAVAGRRGSKWADANLAKNSGCGASFCVGDVVTNISRNYLKAQVVGVQLNGLYVLKFLEGNVAGRLGHNWSDSDLRKFRY